MTPAQKLRIALSKQREKINGLLNQPEADRGDNYETELRAATDAISQTEVEYRAAVSAEPEDQRVEPGAPTDPETRERLALRGKSSMRGFLLAALEGRDPSGAEAEYRAACKVTNGFPVDLFEADRPPETRDVETRAVTPAPATGQGATLAPIQPFVFSESIAPKLGIDMPQVGSGSYSEATITTALPAAATNKGDDAPTTAGAITPVTATARRISARMSVAMEDVATIGVANFEAALRQNAMMALSDEYDRQCITGNGTAPNVNGLIAQLTDPTDPTAVADFDAFLEAFADQIDGLWASTMRNVSIVANVDAYKLSAKAFRDVGTNNGHRGDISAADYLAAHTAGWWTNKRMPATASNVARGIVYRRGRPGLRTATHPVWANVAIDDIYSDSASGTRHFSLHTMVGSAVLIVQPAAYSLAEFKVS